MTGRRGVPAPRRGKRAPAPTTTLALERREKTAAQRRWDLIRAQVKGGFRPELLAQRKTPTGRFRQVVDELAATALLAPDCTIGNSSKLAAYYCPRAGSGPNRHLLAALARVGLEGMSLDRAASATGTSGALLELAREMGPAIRRGGGPESQSLQEVLQRAWLLLLLGLTQMEAGHRQAALIASARALSSGRAALANGAVVASLLEIVGEMVAGDEHERNRVLAAYLLGRFAVVFADDAGVSERLVETFDIVARTLAGLVRLQQARSVVAALVACAGKFIGVAHARAAAVQNAVLFLARQALDWATNVQGDNGQGRDWAVANAVLQMVNTDVPAVSPATRATVGALFKTFVNGLLIGTPLATQRLAVQFVSRWLAPETPSGAFLDAERTLLRGLAAVEAQWLPPLGPSAARGARAAIQARLVREQLASSLRAKRARVLLAAPGTMVQLEPVAGEPGVFSAAFAPLAHTLAIVASLPVHERASVVLSRPLPPLNGVPDWATTTPPLFVEGDGRRLDAALSEAVSACDLAAEVPPGYTYVPTGVTANAGPSGNVGTPAPKRLQQRIRGSGDKLAAGSTGSLGSLGSLSGNGEGIPLGMSRHEPRVVAGRTPAGFSATCPLAGTGDVTAAGLGAAVVPLNPDAGDDAEIPLGCTAAQVPIAWSLLGDSPATLNPWRGARSDFALNAPVVLDVIEPPRFATVRVTCRVSSLDEDTASVEVHGGQADEQRFEAGSSLSLRVRARADPRAWSLVTLAVVRCEVLDGTELALGRSAPTAGNPVAAGNDATGRPFYALPVNLAPLPVGYTARGTAFYERSAPIHAIPAGITAQGLRFYHRNASAAGADDSGRNTLAGHDRLGQPFFVRPGCFLPPASGFTAAGVPYYDAAALLAVRGVPLWVPTGATAVLAAARPARVEDAGDAGLGLKSMRCARFASSVFSSEGHVETLESAAALERELLEHVRAERFDRRRRAKVVAAIRERRQLQAPLCLPDGWDALLRGLYGGLPAVGVDAGSGGALLLLPPTDMAPEQPAEVQSLIKVTLEPPRLDFQSVQTPQVLHAALKFRAARGDHGERDVFVAALPPRMFALKKHHYRVQGDGVVEFEIAFVPERAGLLDTHQGQLVALDARGVRLATCALTATRQTAFGVSPAELDVGYVLPERSKDALFTVENVTSRALAVDVSFESELGCDRGPRRPAFAVDARTVRLGPRETRTVVVRFEPEAPGEQRDVLQVRGPGGDVHKIALVGVGGSPVVLFPESARESALGAGAVARLRCDFMRRLGRSGSVGDGGGAAGDESTALLQNMMAVHADGESRRKAHTVDFGVCYGQASYARVLTLINLASHPLTVALFPHSPLLTCPYLVRVPARLATAVEIQLAAPAGSDTAGVNVTAVIEAVCPDFGSLALHVRAFIGPPFYVLSWEHAFFRPVSLGAPSAETPADQQPKERLELAAVNISHYALSVTCEALEGSSACITGPDAQTVPPFASTMVAFTFAPPNTGSTRGAFRAQFRFCAQGASFPAAMLGRVLSLVGLALAPSPGTDTNNTAFLRGLLSHPRRLKDEFPATDAEREALFGPWDAKEQSARDVELSKNSIQLTGHAAAAAATAATDAGGRRAHAAAIQVRNCTDGSVNASTLTSTCVAVDPRGRTLAPHAGGPMDVVFVPPPDAPECVPVYGFAAVYNERNSGHAHAATVVGRLSGDVFVLPPPSGPGGRVVLDFGRLESSAQMLETAVQYAHVMNHGGAVYSWALRVGGASGVSGAAAGRGKLTGFELGMQLGELQPLELATLPFRLSATVPGTYEALLELTARESLDRQARPTVVATIALRATIVASQLGGVPESVDFGRTVVLRDRKRQMVLSNTGAVPLQVHLLVRSPFDAVPRVVSLEPRASRAISLVYAPRESQTRDTAHSPLVIFCNSRLFSVPVVGAAGVADLVPETGAGVSGSVLALARAREDAIVYTRLVLANRGSLPLRVTGVSCATGNTAKTVAVELLGVVPAPSAGAPARRTEAHRVDYWRVVRRHMPLLLRHADWFRQATPKTGGAGYSSVAAPQDARMLAVRGEPLPLGTPLSRMSVPLLPPLCALELRVSVLQRYARRPETGLEFTYEPEVDADDAPDAAPLAQVARIGFRSTVFRTVLVFPSALDFGLAAAEQYLPGRGTRAIKAATRFITLVNPAWESQIVELTHLPPVFAVAARSWELGPGEQRVIPVTFHPPREQTQFRGEAVFRHRHGRVHVSLCGTGASAQVALGASLLDFGALRVGAEATLQLQLHNRGLLAAAYAVEILQRGSDYKFEDDSDPHEVLGELAAGAETAVSVRVQVKDPATAAADAFLVLVWQRVLGGVWEEARVPLRVRVGHPLFSLNAFELDFGTVFVGGATALTFEVANPGNAACHYVAHVDGDAHAVAAVQVEPLRGIVRPGALHVFRAVYTPVDCAPLACSIVFATDAGPAAVLCYGAVGVPYLSVPPEFLALDAGLVPLRRATARRVPLTNTGHRRVEFSVAFERATVAGLPLASAEPVFAVTPSAGILAPKETLELTFTVTPDTYGAEAASAFVIRSTLGERHSGLIRATGGCALLQCFVHGDALSLLREDQAAPVSTSAVELAARGYLTAVEQLVASMSRAEQRALAASEAAVEDTHLSAVSVADSPDEAREEEQAVRGSVPEHSPTRARHRPSILAGSTDRRTSLARTEAAYAEGTESGYQHSALLAGADSDMIPWAISEGVDSDGEAPLSGSANALNVSSGSNDRRRSSAAEPGDAGPVPASVVLFGGLHADLRAHLERGRALLAVLFSDSGSLPVSSESRQASEQPEGAIVAESPDNPAEEELAGKVVDTGSEPAVNSASAEDAETLDARETPEAKPETPTQPTDETPQAQEAPQEAPEAPQEAPRPQRRETAALVREYLVLARELAAGVKTVVTDADSAAPWTPTAVAARIRVVQHHAGLLGQLVASKAALGPQLGAAKPQTLPGPETPATFALGFVRGRTQDEQGSRERAPLAIVSNAGNLPCALVLRSDEEGDKEAMSLSPETATLEPNSVETVLVVEYGAQKDGLYRRSWLLVRVDDAGEEAVARITCEFEVGNPDVVCDGEDVDFGLVPCGVPATRVVAVTNRGTYRDTVRVRPTLGHVRSAFRAEPAVFELAAGATQHVALVCEPQMMGDVNEAWEVVWAGDPRPLRLAAVGGQARLVVESGSPLEFGTVVVGCPAERRVVLANAGNVAGAVQATPQPGDPLECTLEPADGIAEPGGNVTLIVRCNPTAAATVAGAVVVSVEHGDSIRVPVFARCGVAKAQVEGSLAFSNCLVGTETRRSVFFANVGDLDVPLTATLELAPDTAPEDAQLVCDVAQGALVAPGEKVEVTVVVCAAAPPRMLSGTLRLQTTLGPEPAEFPVPFRLRTFDREMALDAGTDLNLGRIALGERFELERELINNGSFPCAYRVVIDEQSGGPTGPTGAGNRWSVIQGGRGTVPPESVQKFVVEFSARTDTAVASQARVIVQFQRLEDSNSAAESEWQTVAAFRVSGAGGVPLIRVCDDAGTPVTQDPIPVDFGFCALAKEHSKRVTLRNDGNASVAWALVDGGARGAGFRLASSEAAAGRLEPSEELVLLWTFTANAPEAHTASPQVDWGTAGARVPPTTFRLNAQGANFALQTALLPPVVLFKDPVLLGARVTVEFSVVNAGAFPGDVVARIVNALATVRCSTEPARLAVPAGVGAQAPLVVALEHPVPLDDLGNVDAGVTSSLLAKNNATIGELVLAFAHEPDVAVHRAPVVVSAFTFAPLQVGPVGFVSSGTGNAPKIDFGEAPVDVGATCPVELYNPNHVALDVALVASAGFAVADALVTVQPRSTRQISAQLEPARPAPGEPTPPSRQCSGTLTLRVPALEAQRVLPLTTIALEGVLRDRPLRLDLPPRIDVGACFRGGACSTRVSITNPLRRPMKFRVCADPAAGASLPFRWPNHTDWTTVNAQAPIELDLEFAPVAAEGGAAVAVAAIQLETSEGTFATELAGTAITPSISVDAADVDFGVVGVRQPEFRVATVSNPCPLALRVRVACEPAQFGVVDLPADGLVTVDANEVEYLRVRFAPVAANEAVSGFVRLLDASTDAALRCDPPRVLAEIAVRGVGGVFEAEAAVVVPTAPVVPTPVESAPSNVDQAPDVQMEPTPVSPAVQKPAAEPEKPQWKPTAPPVVLSADGPEMQTLTVNLGAVERGKTAQREIRVVNTGSTLLDLEVQNTQGDALDDESAYATDRERLALQVEPSRALVPPDTTQTFRISIEGLENGPETATVVIATRALVEPKRLSIDVAASVSSETSESPQGSDEAIAPVAPQPARRPMRRLNSGVGVPPQLDALPTIESEERPLDAVRPARPVYAKEEPQPAVQPEPVLRPAPEKLPHVDIAAERRRVAVARAAKDASRRAQPPWLTSLQAFVRADTSLAALLDVRTIDRARLEDDAQLWKVLLPIVRIAPVLPSRDMQTVPMVEPDTARPTAQLTPLLSPPPPLASDTVPTANSRKWFSQRVAFQFQQPDGGADKLAVSPSARASRAASLSGLFASPAVNGASSLADRRRAQELRDRRALAEQFVSRMERRLLSEPRSRRV